MMEEAEPRGGVTEEETPPREVNSNCNHTDGDVTSCPAEAPGLPATSQKPGPVVVQGNTKNPASEKLEKVCKWSITTYKVRESSRPSVHSSGSVGEAGSGVPYGGPGPGASPRAAQRRPAALRQRDQAGQDAGQSARSVLCYPEDPGGHLRRAQPQDADAACGVRRERRRSEVSVEEQRHSDGVRQRLHVRHEHSGQQNHGGHHDQRQAVRGHQDRVRRVPSGPGGAEPGTPRRRHSAQAGAGPERLPEPEGQVPEDQRGPVRQSQAAGGEQGESPSQTSVAAPQLRGRSRFIVSQLPAAKRPAGGRTPERPRRGLPLLAGGELTRLQNRCSGD